MTQGGAVGEDGHQQDAVEGGWLGEEGAGGAGAAGDPNPGPNPGPNSQVPNDHVHNDHVQRAMALHAEQALQDAVRKGLRSLLKELGDFDEQTCGGVFAEPVTEQEAPEYFTIIKQPMDLQVGGCALSCVVLPWTCRCRHHRTHLCCC